jgi:hypothetical protein
MMPRQDRVDDLWQDSVVIAVHAGKQRFALFHFAHQIFTQFLADGSARDSFFGPLAAAKFTQAFRQ